MNNPSSTDPEIATGYHAQFGAACSVELLTLLRAIRSAYAFISLLPRRAVEPRPVSCRPSRVWQAITTSQPTMYIHHADSLLLAWWTMAMRLRSIYNRYIPLTTSPRMVVGDDQGLRLLGQERLQAMTFTYMIPRQTCTRTHSFLLTSRPPISSCITDPSRALQYRPVTSLH
ncbi:hypothetical protein LX36DRAFT_258102 [Colletotrichum falcatum]|nr:hypothetical protein LX36DRAFT_258102 [Colletotrichum falcatum]